MNTRFRSKVRNVVSSTLKKKTRTIAVRLDDESLDRLNELHAKWGVSRGEVLRRLLNRVK